MFCALLLAENGYAPLLIERGDGIEKRAATTDAFFAGGELDEESNVMFGAGGAGTFSDGKLVTRINDTRTSWVLRRMREFGAPDDITKLARPHVGTDVLRGVVDNIMREIVRLGGEVRYRCRLDGIDERDGYVVAHTTRGDVPCGAVVLALGHSARDTQKALLASGFALEAKPFSVGVRIEHKASDVDAALYGKYAGDPRLGHAEYNLSDTSDKRGVYSFCMCPGGVVVACSSERDGVVVNGMSYRARSGENSNCALAVSIFPTDFGSTPEGAIEFQRSIERRAFRAAGGSFAAPIETVGDFLSGKTSAFAQPQRILPSYTRGEYETCDLRSILPTYVSNGLDRGIRRFAGRIRGFDAPSAILTGVETRTSSPVRMLRGEDGTAVGHKLVYPCGEGAGYAGGITSAAVDGVAVALNIMRRFAPLHGSLT